MHDLTKNITEQLYDGIINSDDWYAGLDALRKSTESVLFHHAVWDRHAQGITHSISNDALPPEKLREFDLYHAPYDPRIPLIMQARHGEIMVDHEHFTARDMSRNPIYADWLASLGYRHTLGMVLHDDGRAMELLALIRPVDHSSFEGASQCLVSQLMPDLLRASRLRVRMADVAEQAALGMAALDALPQALALVDAGGQLRYANLAAQRMLAGGRGWRLHHGRVCADSPAVQERLERSVKAACRRPARLGGGYMPSRQHAPCPAKPRPWPHGGHAARTAPAPRSSTGAGALGAASRPARVGAQPHSAARNGTRRHAGPDGNRSAAGAYLGARAVTERLRAGAGLQLAHGAHAHQEPDAQDRAAQAAGRGGVGAGAGVMTTGICRNFLDSANLEETAFPVWWRKPFS